MEVSTETRAEATECKPAETPMENTVDDETTSMDKAVVESEPFEAAKTEESCRDDIEENKEVEGKNGEIDEIQKAIGLRTGFTSEAFKIELANLPRYKSIGQMKKLMKKLNLEFHKLKPCGQQATYMFINFSNDLDLEKAVEALNGYPYKGRKLRAFRASAAKDPMMKKANKRLAEENNTDKDSKKAKTDLDTSNEDKEDENRRPAKERLLSAVAPLAHLPYENQIEAKTEIVKDVVENIKIRIQKESYSPAFKEHRDKIAVLEPFVKSPVVNGYRNKCEFSVGKHPESGETTVGFRLASYKKGSVAVVGVDDVPTVSDKMKKVVKHMESFIVSSGLEPYDNISQVGHWKTLMLRTGEKTGDMMAWITIAPEGLMEERKSQLRTEIKEHFDKIGDINSLHLHFFNGRRVKNQPDPPIELLQGKPSITEKLFDLDFGVSPKAFFQVNTEAAEALYSTAGDMAGLNMGKTVLFDVCCGTGTIGLCLASRCKNILGIEIVEEAVADARKNAQENGVKNATFIAGKAEFELPNVLKRLSAADAEDAVAIVDPPRAGLHPKAIHALRASKALKKFVYISCDAKAAAQNFINLAKPTSKAFIGEPYLPTRVVPVDLFPHTNHFELVIVFERVSNLDEDKNKNGMLTTDDNLIDTKDGQ